MVFVISLTLKKPKPSIMKKLNLLFILSISFFILSCNSDDDNSGTSNNSGNLTSISKVYFHNGTFYQLVNYSFEENKLIKIESDNGSTQELFYENDLVSTIIENHVSNNLDFTHEYTYDNSKRLIQKKIIFSPDSPYSNKQIDITYISNTNIMVSTDSDSQLITLNSENFIIENQLTSIYNNIPRTYFYEYVNENLTKYESTDIDGNTTNETTYQYLDKIASDAYSINFNYVFGPEWKNNYELDTQFGLGLELFQISKNYIESYYRYNYITDISRTVSFDYEFDASDNIIDQVKTIVESSGDIFITRTIYEYE